jgi:HSP20 family molecular chaperone IbpA
MNQLTKQPQETNTLERTRAGVMYTPRFDIFENENELILYGDLPGVAKEDLDIHFEKNELSVFGRVALRQDDVNYLYAEYGVGDFYRAFTVGETIDHKNITAELKHGVLTIHLPKSEAVKPRRIEVKAE